MRHALTSGPAQALADTVKLQHKLSASLQDAIRAFPQRHRRAVLEATRVRPAAPFWAGPIPARRGPTLPIRAAFGAHRWALVSSQSSSASTTTASSCTRFWRSFAV
jgi:hypothetical protein